MKKIILLTLAVISLIAINSCKKDNTYNLRFTNTSSNPYKVEVNGTNNILQGNTYQDYKLDKGSYAWTVTQQSGYAIYPTVKSGTVNLDQDREIIFP